MVQLFALLFEELVERSVCFFQRVDVTYRCLLGCLAFAVDGSGNDHVHSL